MMEVHFINVDIIGKSEIDFMSLVTEMQTIPRVGETISFPINEGGKGYSVEAVDYLITEKKQGWIRVWVKLISKNNG